MMQSWMRSLLELVSFGYELSSLHSYKESFWGKIGLEYKEPLHPVYADAKRHIDEGYPFEKIIDLALQFLADHMIELAAKARKAGDLIGPDVEKFGIAIGACFYGDIINFLWDNISSSDQRLVEASFREIYLHPEDFSNLFHPGTFEKYFTSKEYLAQRDRIAELDYSDVDKKRLEGFLEYHKNLEFEIA